LDGLPFLYALVPGRALVWRRGSVVLFADFRPVPLLANEFLLGKQVIGENAVQFPDFIELVQLGGRVVAQVAGEFLDPGPVLLRKPMRCWQG
jgi:hypothetical protein